MSLERLITFAATNIDDIFVLMLFYSQTNETFHRWHIVAGQYGVAIASEREEVVIVLSLINFLTLYFLTPIVKRDAWVVDILVTFLYSLSIIFVCL